MNHIEAVTSLRSIHVQAKTRRSRRAAAKWNVSKKHFIFSWNVYCRGSGCWWGCSLWLWVWFGVQRGSVWRRQGVTVRPNWVFSEGEGALAPSPGQTGVSGSVRWLPGRSGPDTQKGFPSWRVPGCFYTQLGREKQTGTAGRKLSQRRWQAVSTHV